MKKIEKVPKRLHPDRLYVVLGPFGSQKTSDLRAYLDEGFSKMCWAGLISKNRPPTQKPKNERRAKKQGRAEPESRESTFDRYALDLF